MLLLQNHHHQRTITTRRNRFFLLLTTTTSIFLVHTLLLISYHLHCFTAAAHLIDEDVVADPTTTDDSSDDGIIPPPYFYLSPTQKILFTCLAIMAFELLNFLSKHSGEWLAVPEIPVRGKHLDELRTVDYLCIAFSKANTAPFAYFYLQYAWSSSDNIVWSLSDMDLVNTILPISLLFVGFDFFYWILHWILHFQSLYKFIHKHHHIQKAPSRANIDAVNVHPIEFVLGEYNHLWILYIVTTYLHVQVHIVTAIGFLALGGWLAGMNHTRSDIVLHLSWLTLFDSKVHDVHHRIPNCNYGQYTMFWDKLFGTFRPYNPKDRINANMQLDKHTGKTIGYISSAKKKNKSP